MNYLTTNEIAKIWQISNRRVQMLASKGRIKGALKKGGIWLIPDYCVKPTVNKKIENTKFNRNILKKYLKTITSEFSKFRSQELRSHILSVIHSLLIQNISKEIFYDKVMFGEYIFINYLSNFEMKFNKSLYLDIYNKMESYFDFDGGAEDILSWSYQYLNIYLGDNSLSNTQFFTEHYMIDYLLENINSKLSLFDPCCGGGNILTQALEYYYYNNDIELNDILVNLVGYELDPILANIATLNLKLKALTLLKESHQYIDYNTWEQLSPNIYTSVETNEYKGSLDNTTIINIRTKEKDTINAFLNRFSNVITNPPFATIKGMNSLLKNFLKENYPDSNSDICVAFLDRLIHFSTDNGTILVVSQNSWMFLNSFRKFREKFLSSYFIDSIADLGTGAFMDLSGEKANVALIKYINKKELNSKIKFLNLKNLPFESKSLFLNKDDNTYYLDQNNILQNENHRFDVLNLLGFRRFFYSSQKIKDFATPMQGTSTGDNKNLVDYFWNHFNDTDWKLVSKGGGYSRWYGLNNFVVKWGKDAEFIKRQPGSALRNEKYFAQTQLVFSDTGTSGLNVRRLKENQLFIASGPGIRVSSGDYLALLAYLNSRIATYYIRILSPKLTIAAGYIANLPITEKIMNSDYLSALASICLESKKTILMNRPNNIEYSFSNLQIIENDITKTAEYLFLSELHLEYQKLLAEEQIEDFLNLNLGLKNEDIQLMSNELGVPVYKLSNTGSSKSFTIDSVDKAFDYCTNLSASLIKRKNSKHHVGADGILEYVSLILNTHPFELLQFIELNINDFDCIIKKYENLILHNFILSLYDYNTISGFNTSFQIEPIKAIQKQFSICEHDIVRWITETFPKVHEELFMGSNLINLEKHYEL